MLISLDKPINLIVRGGGSAVCLCVGVDVYAWEHVKDT